MKITVLGSSSGMAVPQRYPSAYLVESFGHLFLIDAGDGVARQLAAYGKDCSRVESVCISHTHPDHAGGLFTLLQTMHLAGRKTPLQIHMPGGILPGFNTVFPYFQIYREKWPFKFDLLPISDGVVFETNGFQLAAVPNNHLGGNRPLAEKVGIGWDSYSFRLSEKKKAVLFTSDVPNLLHLRSVSSGVDALLTECTHIRIEEILDFAETAEIPRVILTHIPQELENLSNDKSMNHDSIKIEFALDGYAIEV